MEARKRRWKYGKVPIEVWKYGSMEVPMEVPMEVWKCVRKERMGWPTVPGRAVLSVSIIRTFELSHFACSVYLVTLCLQAPRVYKAEQWRCTCGYEMRFIPTRLCHCYALIRHPSIRGLEQRLRPTPAGTRPVRAETRF